MTFDTHLINEALTALGITVGIAILMTAAIIGIAATQLRRKPSSGKPSSGKLTAAQASAAPAQTAREREPQAA